MANEITISEAAKLLEAADNILITAHIRPDEDTLGSTLALRSLLRELGKTAHIVCDDKLSRRSQRIFGIESFSPELLGDFKPEFIVAVDTATLQLGGGFLTERSDLIDLKLDHHPDGERYAKYNYIDGTKSACGEIVYLIAQELSSLSLDTASYIYTAIASDTGGFKYSNVTPDTFRIAAKLLELGVDCAAINHSLFECVTQKEIVATTVCYNALHYYMDGKIAVICFTNEMKEQNGLDEDDIGGISSIPRRIEGVELSIVIKQKPDVPREFKISMRSGPTIEANRLCELFGGGGHVRASGAMIEADNGEDAERVIVDGVLKELGADR